MLSVRKHHLKLMKYNLFVVLCKKCVYIVWSKLVDK